MNTSLFRSMKDWPWLVLLPVVFFVAVGVLGPSIMPYDPGAQDYDVTLAGPSWAHWLGTDYLGRDILSRIIGGARISLVAMVIVLVAALAIGVSIGSFAGYVGGRVELVLISLIDIALALPSLVIALALIGILGTGYWSMITALTLAWWANYARMSRAVVTAELQQPYIEAARVMGASHLWIFVRHILPHVLALVVVYASADAGALVLAIATLSFLGLGVAPPAPEWGQMLVDGMSYIEEYPRLVVLPGLALTLVVVSFNLLGETFALQKVPRPVRGGLLRKRRKARAVEEAERNAVETGTAAP
ncbi:nickel ABC transporter permease [Mesorhizobium sp. LSJC268A00]|uniref:ABC transporter permease n=1 Tax=unclassified Mesorhizobium TaxID=325217 RepID=UPI0003CEE74F|nr:MULTISPECIES: ABC transporter permease [unclassified Mesorhizobium]ESW82131.1 nickel ABC transporter permease [Mesorhizobium sp. LSJC285A00]ESW93156.1 nickel ABC transporter permease [Mesorhizobium sp. LSJC269B00]ESX06574.1 nickel ABC transporter permease [Mesorhizobium sp. LSJC268A00]ESX20629.1 nickel ABC transporter permease [Mesorhizobium sp. LSJC255A00]ESZ09228.1 nickel ABC transporter permease [Mesorhizobium sp. L2C089B000]